MSDFYFISYLIGLFDTDLLILAGVNRVAFRVNGVNLKIFPSELVVKIKYNE